MLLWNALSGIALGAIAIALAMMAAVVYRLVREARATGSLRHKMPTHILLVGTGTIVWGVAQLDTVYDHVGDGLPPEWSAAPAGLIGALILQVGLWKMIEVQGMRYQTLGGQAAPRDAAGELAEDAVSLPERNAERISRVFVEMRVLFCLAMIGLIFGFWQTATVARDNCEANNRQNRTLKSLVEARLVSDPVALARDPVAARTAKIVYEKALAELDSPLKCPTKDL